MFSTQDWDLAMDTVDWMAEQGVTCNLKYGKPLQCVLTGRMIPVYQVANSATGDLIKILES